VSVSQGKSVSSQQNTGNSSAPGTFHKSYQKSYTIRYGAEGMRMEVLFADYGDFLLYMLLI